MNEAEIKTLTVDNGTQLSKMNIAAAGLVSSLLDELQRETPRTFIRLINPSPRGHTVEYHLVEGDRALVVELGDDLGFKMVTDTTIVVHHG